MKHKFRINVNPELNKYDDQVLFPEKVAKATEFLNKAGLPEQKAKKLVILRIDDTIPPGGVLYHVSIKKEDLLRGCPAFYYEVDADLKTKYPEVQDRTQIDKDRHEHFHGTGEV